MKRPRRLGPGSRIRIIAPASAPDPERLARGVPHLRALGFEVDLDPLVTSVRRQGYLAAPDQERADAVTRAFADPDVDGIVCSNGGYGCLRILPHVDFDVVRQNPKAFVGFSDVTALHLAIHKEANLVTFHGPMACAGEDWGLALEWTRARLRDALTSAAPLGDVSPPPERGGILRSLHGGRASGRLVGGNLTLAAATLGTPWEIDTRGAVLFLEEWKEPPFAIDTLLMQLKLAGKLDDAAAIAFGEFPECEPLEKGPTLYVDEVLQDIVDDLDKPILHGLPAGHGHQIATLPLGVRATVDGDARRLIIEETATSDPA